MPPKRQTPKPEPVAPLNLSVAQMRKGIQTLYRRVVDVEQFNAHGSDDVRTALQTSIGETLERVFGHGTRDYQRFISAARFDQGPISFVIDGARPSRTGYIVEGRKRSLALLGQAIAMLEERIADAEPEPGLGAEPAVERALDKTRVFVVHGRDAVLKSEAARFLEKLKLMPVILDEHANEGMTGIAKFEKHSDVSFAIVLLTPDDKGALDGEALRPRARQNVVLELGYFFGKLGRGNVCVLARGEELERPSDIGGIVSVKADGNWKIEIARDLRSAGFAIDMNLVI